MLAGLSELAYYLGPGHLDEKRVPLLSDYQFDLPSSLIAQQPAPVRDGSRLMVVGRDGALVRHGRITDLATNLATGGDALGRPCLFVVNNTSVLPVRLFVNRQGGGRAELLLLPYSFSQSTASTWAATSAASDGPARTMRCLAKPMRRLRPKMELEVLTRSDRLAPEGRPSTSAKPGGSAAGDILEVVEKDESGVVVAVKGENPRSLLEIISEHGEVPLPPYIRRPDGPWASDGERYQTLFAERAGAVAAPTAGLHFSKPLVDRLQALGHRFASITLHVGPSTFLPLKQEQLDRGTLAPEWYALAPETVAEILAAKREGRPVIAVGTTTVRALESAALAARAAKAHELISPVEAGWANAFVQPGFAFQVVDGMLTNFHLPGSSLLLLVSAWFGRQALLDRYRDAIGEGYRFYSYGDAMLILPASTSQVERGS